MTLKSDLKVIDDKRCYDVELFEDLHLYILLELFFLSDLQLILWQSKSFFCSYN